jgi:uncharacterized phiE125 gp8 family phage protein
MSDVLSSANSTQGLTLTEAKAHLNVSSTQDDALITTYIKAAVKAVENRTNRHLMHTTRKLTMDGFTDARYVSGRRIYPERTPLVSASSTQGVQYYDTNGTLTTLATSDYVWSTGGGFIAEAHNATWPNTYAQADSVVITYVAGHSSVSTSVPENVKLACKQLIAHWYRNREAVLTGTISKDLEWTVDALLEGEHRERYA